jgi:membrane associated rhomboid family serine protease
MGTLSLVTLLIIGANVLISLKGLNDYSFFERYKFNTAAIRNKEYIRMFSSGFLHVDMTHLFFNMFTLFIFANVVVGTLGSVSFLLIYIASLLAGNVLSYNFHKHQPNYNAVGASGAVTGIVYASILLYPDMSLYLFFIPIPIPAWIFGILYLLYSIYGMKKQLGNIGHDAHFGGAIAGYVMTLLLVPSLFYTHTWIVVILAVPIVILFAMQRSGKL